VSEERLEDFMAKAARKSLRSTTRKPRPRRGAKVRKSEFAVSELFSPVELELFFQKAERFQKGGLGSGRRGGNQYSHGQVSQALREIAAAHDKRGGKNAAENRRRYLLAEKLAVRVEKDPSKSVEEHINAQRGELEQDLQSNKDYLAQLNRIPAALQEVGDGRYEAKQDVAESQAKLASHDAVVGLLSQRLGSVVKASEIQKGGLGSGRHGGNQYSEGLEKVGINPNAKVTAKTDIHGVLDTMTNADLGKGYGYLGERGNHLRSNGIAGIERVKMADKILHDAAIKNGWNYHDLATFVDSKAGRHFGDVMFGQGEADAKEEGPRFLDGEIARSFTKGESDGHPFRGNQWEKSLGTTDIAIANVLKENFTHDQLDEIVSSRDLYLSEGRMSKIETPEEWSGFLTDMNEDYKRWSSPQERRDNPETPQSFVDFSKAMSKALNSTIAQLDAMPVTKGGPGSGRHAEAGNMTQSGHRPLSEIASEIRRDWGSKVFFGAKPYLDAMGDLNDITDKYGLDSAKSIVNYFLANASTWRGDKAKEIKAELKKIVR
jgi:hypothetical protein